MITRSTRYVSAGWCLNSTTIGQRWLALLSHRVRQQRPFFEGESLSPAQRRDTRFAKNDAGATVLFQYFLNRFRSFAQIVENRLARMSKAGAHHLPQELFIFHLSSRL